MRQIKKNKEPHSLTEHEKKKGSDYDNYPDKNDIRKAIFAEQRGICCYCMGPILHTASSMKIEHFKCQEYHPELQLKYWNMLGACMGNEGQDGKHQHCDTFKGNKTLTFYPPDKMNLIEDMLLYGNDGGIHSKNEKLDAELNNVLNLNVPKLKNNRKAVLDGFKDSLKRYKGPLKQTTLKRWLNDWAGTSHQNDLNPYCMVVVFWLQKKAKQI